MKKILILLLFIFQQALAHAQTGNKPIADTAVYMLVEQIASFPGGEKKMHEFIKKNLNHPPAAYKEGRAGVSYIYFVVERDGNITNVKVLRGASGGADLDEEAMRLIKSMPKWNPGKQNGHTVRTANNFPVRFQR